MVENSGIDNIIAMVSMMHIGMITELNMAAAIKSSDWWLDPGATIHVCNDKAQFKTYEASTDNKEDKVPYLIQALSVSTNSSFVAQQTVPENKVEQVELLAAVENSYGGVVVDVTEPMDSAGKKGVGIKMPIERSNLVDAAVKEGFRYHHAESDYLMLVSWIPETDDRLPANASHRVGIGAFVMNGNREVYLLHMNLGSLLF
ncbi:hypothetical protein COP2_047100 [Malus domestica]